MALSQLKSVQFDHYIPFATSANGTVDFGSSDIVTTGGIVAAGGNIGDVSFSSCGDIIAAGTISALNGNFSVSSCGGDVSTCGNITAGGSISALNGNFSVSSCGGSVSTCGDISAAGSIVAAGGGNIGGVSISSCGEIQTCGYVVANRLCVDGCGFEVYEHCGETKVDVSGTVNAITLSASTSIYGSGFSATSGNVDAAGHIQAYGGLLEISSGSGNNVFKVSSNSGASSYWAYMKLNSGGTVVSGYICPDTQGYLRFNATCPAPSDNS